jgi:hypothetical protein
MMSKITYKGFTSSESEWDTCGLIARLKIENISSKYGLLKDHEIDNSTSYVILPNNSPFTYKTKRN